MIMARSWWGRDDDNMVKRPWSWQDGDEIMTKALGKTRLPPAFLYLVWYNTIRYSLLHAGHNDEIMMRSRSCCFHDSIVMRSRRDCSDHHGMMRRICCHLLLALVNLFGTWWRWNHDEIVKWSWRDYIMTRWWEIMKSWYCYLLPVCMKPFLGLDDAIMKILLKRSWGHDEIMRRWRRFLIPGIIVYRRWWDHNGTAIEMTTRRRWDSSETMMRYRCVQYPSCFRCVRSVGGGSSSRGSSDICWYLSVCLSRPVCRALPPSVVFGQYELRVRGVADVDILRR